MALTPNNQITATVFVPPTFVARPGESNSSIITRLNTDPKFVVKATELDDRIEVKDPLTIRSSVNDVNPIRITQLIDVNTALITDGSFLIYNEATDFFEVRPLSELSDLIISNTITISTLSANGSVGLDGQLLASNGTSVYWTSPSTFLDEIDGGFY